MHTQNRKESAMDITGVGNLSYLYNYGISDSDTRHVTGKENGIGSVDENGKQKECQTCKNRKYVDGSDEANVSFKSAAHVSPQAASSAVRAHEGQHVSNAYSKASEENGRVISASVQIHTSICPECGRSYVSGGVTNTQIRAGTPRDRWYGSCIPGASGVIQLLE